jgi:sugar phosphate isomerase/epimerase
MPMPEPLGLNIAMAGLDPRGAVPMSPSDGANFARRVWTLAAGAGFAGVQLNAALPGLRPRELDRSARRDLGVELRRRGLSCSGVDLFIPPEHLADPSKTDRAAASLSAAIELAAELGARGGVCTVFPKTPAPGVVEQLAGKALHAGVRLVNCAHPVDEGGDPSMAVGLDCAAVLAGDADPAQALARLGARVGVVRVADVARGAVMERVAPGSRAGRLDVFALRVAIEISAPSAAAVLDLRGVNSWEGSFPYALAAWAGGPAGPAGPGGSR